MRQKDTKKKGLFNYKKIIIIIIIIIIIEVIQYYNKITSYFKIFTKKNGTVPRKQDLIIEKCR